MIRGGVIHGDAGKELRKLARRPGWNRRRVVVLTDPPWPDCEHVVIDGATEAVKLWRRIARVIPLVADRLILHLGRGSDPRNDVIVDPFCGSGTTLVAASRAGLQYIGIDSDERWVAEATERLERAEAQQVLDLEVGPEPSQIGEMFG